MAAIIGNIHGKVLLQIGDSEPTEVGTLLIPLEATAPKQVGHSINMVINTDLTGNPVETAAKIKELFRFTAV